MVLNIIKNSKPGSNSVIAVVFLLQHFSRTFGLHLGRDLRHDVAVFWRRFPLGLLIFGGFFSRKLFGAGRFNLTVARFGWKSLKKGAFAFDSFPDVASFGDVAEFRAVNKSSLKFKINQTGLRTVPRTVQELVQKWGQNCRGEGIVLNLCLHMRIQGSYDKSKSLQGIQLGSAHKSERQV